MKKHKKKINIFLIIIATFLVLYFTLVGDYNNIIQIILKTNLFWFIMGMILVFGCWFFKALAFHDLIRNFNEKQKFSKSFKIIITTQFFNAVTPFASGGQPYQIYALKKDDLCLTDATNITIQNFIVYQIAFILISIMAITTNSFLNTFDNIEVIRNFVTLGLSVNVLLILILIIIIFSKKLNSFVIKFIFGFLYELKIIKNKAEKIEKFERYISKFQLGAQTLLKNKKQFAKAILYNFIGLFSYYLVPLTILYGIGDYTSMNALTTIISSSYVMLISSFIPTPGSMGGIEYGFITFFGNFVIGSSLKATMLIWRFLTYYLGLFLGAIALNVKERSK